MGKSISKVFKSKIKNLAKLMRPQQWFKSLSIFIGASVVIYEQGLQTLSYLNLLLVLLAVSLFSSTVYVLNDISDIKKDRLHPLKKKRPLASGKVSIKEGLILGLGLLIISSLILYYLKPLLLLLGFLIIINNLVYSFKPLRVKKIPVLDVLIPGLDFTLRVMIGWYALTNKTIYPALLLFPLFTAGFLLSCKRLAEYHFLGLKAPQIRKVFNYYNSKKLYLSINLYFSLSIVLYFILSSIFSYYLFILSPWFFIQMQWYKQFLKEKKSVVKKPEDVFFKKKLFTISGLLLCVTWLFIILL